MNSTVLHLQYMSLKKKKSVGSGFYAHGLGDRSLELSV